MLYVLTLCVLVNRCVWCLFTGLTLAAAHGITQVPSGSLNRDSQHAPSQTAPDGQTDRRVTQHTHTHTHLSVEFRISLFHLCSYSSVSFSIYFIVICLIHVYSECFLLPNNQTTPTTTCITYNTTVQHNPTHTAYDTYQKQDLHQQ